MNQLTDKGNSWYLANFKTFEKHLNGESKTELHSIRKDALARFMELGFPSTHNEEWRFTNILPIANAAFKPALKESAHEATAESIQPFLFDDLKCHRLVFLNGHFSETLSSIHTLPKGVKVLDLSSALKSDYDLVNQYLTKYAKFDENAFTALNTAFIEDGAFIFVPDNIIVEVPW